MQAKNQIHCSWKSEQRRYKCRQRHKFTAAENLYREGINAGRHTNPLLLEICTERRHAWWLVEKEETRKWFEPNSPEFHCFLSSCVSCASCWFFMFTRVFGFSQNHSTRLADANSAYHHNLCHRKGSTLIAQALSAPPTNGSNKIENTQIEAILSLCTNKTVHLANRSTAFRKGPGTAPGPGQETTTEEHLNRKWGG